jgi:hypothetical protein
MTPATKANAMVLMSVFVHVSTALWSSTVSHYDNGAAGRRGSLWAFADEAYPLDATDKDQTAQALILGAIFDVPLAQPLRHLGAALWGTGSCIL